MKSSEHFKKAIDAILTNECRQFINTLHQEFESERQKILQRRRNRARAVVLGERFDFLPETRNVRESQWQVAPTPADLQDRRVEITGPAEAKMIINAMNSGAKVFMADLEDALSPTWENIILGHQALGQAVRRTLVFENEAGKKYELQAQTATLVVRPRGLHLPEAHFDVHGEPVSGALFDFAVYFFHNAQELRRQGRTPAFYLPKLESHLEARWWNEVFNRAQDLMGIPRGTIRATVLIETIAAAFEMHEILFELRDHSAGLNAGRWDYIFSLIKKHNTRADFVLPDRAQITMTTGFMSAYAELLVQVCHTRNAHAIGGMAAFIPNRKEPQVTELALKKVSEDKAREAALGFDGSWVAHPDLVPVARAEFDKVLGARPHQKEKIPARTIYASELLDMKIPGGQITEAGVRNNISVCLQYLDKWLDGLGAVAIHNLMEDAATAEISRTQLWQWLHHRAQLSTGVVFDRETYLKWRSEELKKLLEHHGAPRLERSMTILDDLVLRHEFTEFLTLESYPRLVEPEKLFLNWSLPNTRGGKNERTTAGF